MTYQHFLQLPVDKQKQILDACLDEFIARGYDSASTNRMVEQAGISKGVLFKYFTNKETLFQEICERSGDVIAAAVTEGLSELPDDFFEALKAIAWKELRAQQQHPKLFALFRRLMSNPEHPVYASVLQSYGAKSQALYLHLVQALSTAKLRPDLPLDKAFAMVGWVFEGLKKTLAPLQPPVETADTETMAQWQQTVMREMDVYIELLKRGLYSEE